MGWLHGLPGCGFLLRLEQTSLLCLRLLFEDITIDQVGNRLWEAYRRYKVN